MPGSLIHRGLIPGQAIVYEEAGRLHVGDRVIHIDGDWAIVKTITAIGQPYANFPDVLGFTFDDGTGAELRANYLIRIPPQNPRTYPVGNLIESTLTCPNCGASIRLRHFVDTGVLIAEDIWVHGTWLRYRHADHPTYSCPECSWSISRAFGHPEVLA